MIINPIGCDVESCKNNDGGCCMLEEISINEDKECAEYERKGLRVPTLRL